MKKLGIIGGMGPAATARLFDRIVSFTAADRDQDHIDITILNRPGIPDRTAFLLGKSSESFLPHLQEAAKFLENAECSIIAIPCNTSHALIGDVESVLASAQIVNMPLETMRFAEELGCRQLGILATDGTLATGVFQKCAEAAGVKAALPDAREQKRVMSIIYDGVKAGRDVAPEKLYPVFDQFLETGCDGFVLGCTELSVIGEDALYKGAPIIDALDVLAWRCVQKCEAEAADFKSSFVQ